MSDPDRDVELDRKVLEWHEGPSWLPGFDVPLSEYLGMTPTEYEEWVIRR